MKYSKINYKAFVICLVFFLIATFTLTKVSISVASANQVVSAGGSQNTSNACLQTIFRRTPSFETDAMPSAVTVEDFDGDGRADIATAGSRISVLRNTSTGQMIAFAPKVSLNTTSGGFAIASGDFDGDGFKDIVTANFSSPAVSVIRNASTPGIINFNPNVDFAVGSMPRSVTVADFDGDGRVDIATANAGSGDISVLRNTSSGAGVFSFDPAVNISFGGQPRAVIAADFNGDGKPDIAAAGGGDFDDRVSVLRNTSEGAGMISFAGRADFTVGAAPGARPSSLTAADFDGDGRIDIVTSDVESSFVTVLRNTGSRPDVILFAPKIHFRTAFGPFSITARDLDGDGKPDLATANFYSRTVSVLRNISAAGAINFEFRKEYVVGRSPTGIAGGDFNRDGRIDLTTSNFRSNSVSVLRNTSPGAGIVEFDAQSEIAITGEAPFSIAAGDFDGDGRRDLVTANLNSNNITILRNISVLAGMNRFSPGIEIAAENDSGPHWVAVQDFDGDGRDDIVIANSNSDSISVLRNTSAGTGLISFAPPVNFPVGDSPRFVAAGDFDNDGKFDIAVANFSSDSISILINNSPAQGQISFAPRMDLSVNSNPTSLTINDFNADGLPDIAVANSGSGNISVFENLTGRGFIRFSGKKDFSVNSQPTFITSDDLDGDGKPDLAVSNFSPPNSVISVLRNLSPAGGQIEFAPKVDFPITSNPELTGAAGHIITARINNDNKPDIVVVNTVLSVITLLRNAGSPGNIRFESQIDIPASATTSALTAGDFNRDGLTDIAYSSFNSNNVGILQNPCSINRKTRFDYDGDGRADVSVFRPSTGIWVIQNSSDDAFNIRQFGLSNDLIVPADYDGDDKTDIAVFRPSNGGWYRINSSNGAFSAEAFGQNGDIPVPADYDGDGRDDPAIFRPSNGTWYLWQSSAGFLARQFGTSGDIPTIGDFDGDGRADLAVFRPSTGTWFRINSGTGQFFAAQFGAAGDKPVPADYDGDGRTDLAVYRPANGAWYRLNSSNGGFVAVAFGIAEDKPVPADYDGDGRTDIAVYRPSEGNWYLLRSTAGFTAVRFGVSEDIPTPNTFVR